MLLFNLSDAPHALLNVAMRRLKVSRIADLNDPFELLSVNLRDKRLRDSFQEAKASIHSANGVLCFSRSWSNPVLWSHYADKHRGICLGFEVDDNCVMPVSYETDLTKLKLAENVSKEALTQQYMRKLLSTKFRDWAYEDEARVYIELDHSSTEGGLYFSEFSSRLELREIILGARCEVPISKARELASRFEHKVHVLKARLAFTKFSVVENRKFRNTKV
jgi:hypothetical protein